jgi:hypothetical protein
MAQSAAADDSGSAESGLSTLALGAVGVLGLIGISGAILMVGVAAVMLLRRK